MKKFAALIAPVLLTSFSAIAAPPEAKVPGIKVNVEAVAPNKRIVTLDITQICGAKDTIRENLSNIGDTIIDTYTIMGRPCAAGETPQRQHVEIPVDLADTARILMGVKSPNPEFKVITKFEIR